MSAMTVFRVLLLVILFALLAVGAAATLGIQVKSGERIEIGGDQEDLVFAAGGKVRIGVTTPDDIYALGGAIDVIGTAADHVSLAAGEIVISGLQANDLQAIAGDLLFLEGVLVDDMIASAAEITIREKASVQGSAVLAGAEIVIEAPVGTDLQAVGEIVTINAPIGGNANIRARHLIVGDRAVIAGNLRYRAERTTISDAAAINGETVILPPDERFASERLLRRAIVAVAIFGAGLAVGLIILVLILISSLPALMRQSQVMLQNEPLKTLGIGFLITLVTPAVIALLVASIVGIPLGMLIAIIYAALIPLALAGSIYWLGMLARDAFSGGDAELPGVLAKLGWSGLVALILLLFALVPFVGGFIWLLVIVIGLGATAVQVWIALSRPRADHMGF